LLLPSLIFMKFGISMISTTSCNGCTLPSTIA
jgi:hypothetical protein